MPKPNPNESKEDFIKRCMEQLVGEEGRPQDQAYAMCQSFWEERERE